MSALTFTLKHLPDADVDLSPLTPDRLQNLSPARLSALELDCGAGRIKLQRLFKVSGNDPSHIRILKSTVRLSYIGRDMTRGRIEVHGDAGDFLGLDMRGGVLRVQGDAGHWAGSGLRGGRIEITGNAGDYLAAARPAVGPGMIDGMILVHGNVGDRAGDRMRRGIVIILGDAGDYCGARMIAGTILVFGEAGRYPGFDMRRGTIILANKPKIMTATFRSCGELKMEFLRLLFRQLAGISKPLMFLKTTGPESERFAGDLAGLGKGEILILARED
jgi:formylmethanofuran dehydrogenase subunit C